MDNRIREEIRAEVIDEAINKIDKWGDRQANIQRKVVRLIADEIIQLLNEMRGNYELSKNEENYSQKES